MTKLQNSFKPMRIDTGSVCAILGISKSTLFRRLKDDDFPKPAQDRKKFYWSYDVITAYAKESLGVK